MLPDGIGAEIQLGTWDVPVSVTSSSRRLPDSESFRTWNMGMGLIVVNADDAEAASFPAIP